MPVVIHRGTWACGSDSAIGVSSGSGGRVVLLGEWRAVLSTGRHHGGVQGGSFFPCFPHQTAVQRLQTSSWLLGPCCRKACSLLTPGHLPSPTAAWWVGAPSSGPRGSRDHLGNSGPCTLFLGTSSSWVKLLALLHGYFLLALSF